MKYQPFHFNSFWCERRDLSCRYSNGDIFTCEDIKFSRESSPSISLVACVASGSARVRRENWNESKKRNEGGGGGGGGAE